MEQHCPSGTLLDAHAWFSEEVTGLDGKWRFLDLNGPEPDGWLEQEYDDRKWSRVLLPETGTEAHAGKGLYRKAFQLSGNRGSRRVILRFAQISEELSLWINGQFQGTATDLWGDVEFDITSALRKDGNQVCIRSSGPLTGSIGLYVLPLRAITDVRFCRRSTGQGASALSVQVRCTNSEGFTVRMALMDGPDIVSHGEGVVRDGVCEALLDMEGIRCWNPEAPALYRLALILWDGLAIHHTREMTIGIREAKAEEKLLTVNGRSEQIFAMLYLPNTEEARIAEELQVIRNHNFNGILLRCRANDALLSACDRIGLYVLEQTGIPREARTEALPERLSVPRASHPCLIGWDLDATDTIPLTMGSELKLLNTVPETWQESVYVIGAYRNTSYDGQPVPGFVSEQGALLPGIREARRKLAPVVCRFSDGVLTLENRSRFLSTGAYDGRLVLCRDGEETVSRAIEQNVLPGESITFPVETRYDIYKPGRYHLSAEFRRKEDGILLSRDQWEVGNLRHIYDENPGGTIRNTVPETWQESVYVIGAYRNTSYDGQPVPGFVSEQGALLPGIREARRKLAPVVCRFSDGVLTLENRSRFLSTGAYDGRLVLCRDGEETVSRAIEQNVLPGESITFPVETRYDIYKPGRYHLSAEFRRKEDGILLSRDQWEVGNLRHIYDENPGGTIREEAGLLLLRSQDSGYTIDRSTGCPEQISCFGLELLTQALTPVFSEPMAGLRLPDEWERFTARWKKPRPAILEVDQMTRRVSASFRLGSGLMQTYRLFTDGSLALELRLRTGKTAPDRMGWKCKLDSRLTQCRWFGLGPDSSGEGRYFGIHQGLPEDQGLRETVYALTLADEAGAGMKMRSEEGFRFSLWEGTLTLLLPESVEWKPHTTYTFHLTISPCQWK